MVDSTGGDYGSRRLGRRVIDLTAFSSFEDVALGALAGKSAEDVGGVGRADIAESSDEIESLGTDAALVTIYLISSAGRIILDVGVADAVGHVVPQDANAFAKDVVIDLIDGAVDSCGGGSSCGRDVSRVGDVGGGRGVGSG